MIFANPIESPLTIISQIQVANCLGETLNNLLHGSSIVRTVSQDNVNVIVVQSLEGALQALDNVLLGETTSVGLLATSTKEDLGRNNVLVSGVSELVQSTSVNARLVFASSTTSYCERLGKYMQQDIDTAYPISISDWPLA